MPNEQTSAAAVERLGESLFALSAKIKPLLRDDETHRAYERVVADFDALAKPATPIEGDAELVDELREGASLYRDDRAGGVMQRAADRIEALATLQRKGPL
jgi:hypothetical protein